MFKFKNLYPRETLCVGDITELFIVSSILIAKTWKQLACPLECISKLSYSF